MTTIEHQQYLDQLKHYVHVELVPKTAIFDCFTRHAPKLADSADETEPLIWFLSSGLHYDLTFSLYRLYDTNSDCNIYDFVKMSQLHSSTIKWKNPITPQEVATHIQLLSSIEPQKERLRKRRNKFFAHYDKKYFYDPDKIEVDFPFSNSDAIDMVKLLQKILNDYSNATSGTRSMSIEQVFYVAAENLYKRIMSVESSQPSN